MELNCKLYVFRKVYESIFQRFKRCLNPNFLEKVMPVLQNSVWAENGLAFERGVPTPGRSNVAFQRLGKNENPNSGRSNVAFQRLGVPTWRSNAWAKMKILTLDVPTWRSNAWAFQRGVPTPVARSSRIGTKLVKNLSNLNPNFTKVFMAQLHTQETTITQNQTSKLTLAW